MKKILLLVFASCFISGITKANNYLVTSVSDTGAGSLRAMIDSVDNDTGLDTITLQLSAHDTIHLGSPLPFISDSLVITGLPCQNPTISGDSLGFIAPAFFVSNDSTPLTLNYLNIINCQTIGSDTVEGAIVAASLYINYCYFYGNSYTRDALTVVTGGAVNAMTLWAYNSTFNSNSCNNTSEGGDDADGGALIVVDAYLFNCTFTDNYASAWGGAISGHVDTVINCTFTGNYAGIGGGAIFGGARTSAFTISNNIFWGNSNGDTSAYNSSGIEFYEGVISGGCNILQDSAAVDSFTTVATDVVGINPQFGVFSYYSGCVPVLPILCGSIAQNHASCPGATDTDEQGIAAQGVRDAGAFEITYPNLGGDTIDSIPYGGTADLFNYFNTTGLTIQWPDSLNDSTAAIVGVGSYTVIGTNFLGCSDTATATIVYNGDTISGLKNLLSYENIKLYPNPARDAVTIEWEDNIPATTWFRVTDMPGRVVLMQNTLAVNGKFTVDISSLSSGAYYVNLNSNGANIFGCKLIVLPR